MSHLDAQEAVAGGANTGHRGPHGLLSPRRDRIPGEAAHLSPAPRVWRVGLASEVCGEEEGCCFWEEEPFLNRSKKRLRI